MKKHTYFALSKRNFGLKNHTLYRKSSIKYYPLTYPQKGIWYSEKLYPSTGFGNISASPEIIDDINCDILKEAINICIFQNPGIRIHITLESGRPKQYISKYNYYIPEILNFTDTTITQLHNWEKQQDLLPFDLIDSDLFYFAIIKTSSNHGACYIKLHHIISDAWTTILICNQIVEYYYLIKKNITIPKILKPSYIDFILRQELYKASDKFVKDKLFWEEKFSTVPEFLTLKDHARNFINTKSSRKTFNLPQQLALNIHNYCSEYSCSAFVLFLTAIAIYINKTTSKSDIVLGTPILNRANAKEKSTAGMFISTIPVRLYIDSDLDFKSLALNISRDFMSMLRHQKYPLELIHRYFRDKHKVHINLYDILVSFQNAKMGKDDNGVEIQGRWSSNIHQTESIIIHITDRGENDSYEIVFDYLVNDFEESEIDQLYKYILKILEDSILHPLKTVGNISLLNEEEKEMILKINNTDSYYPKDKTIQEIFEDTVRKTPKNMAAIFLSQTITYDDLNKKSNQLARLLRQRNVVPDSIVAIIVPRSFEMIIGILGILKSGGAYLPIDPTYPQERINFFLRDSQCNIILTYTKFIEQNLLHVDYILLDNYDIYHGNDNNLDIINTPNDLAYVIYTSGSKGESKGCMVEHHSVINNLYWRQQHYPLSESDTILQKTTFTFDVSVWELFWGTFALGATTCFLPPHGEKDPNIIIDTVYSNKITTIHFVPSMFNSFLRFLETTNSIPKLHTLRYIFTSGEALTIQQAKRFNNLFKSPSIKLCNLYGPTETTIEVSYYDCLSIANLDFIPIGKPINNIKLYILDKNNNLQPIGIPGELYISGAGLSRGYLNHPQLTNEKFVPNPFLPNQKMYKTGDIASYQPDGNIKYIGRIDNQIKIRGFRIELGEIESKLSSYNSIKEVAVVLQDNPYGEKNLCAYFSASTDINIHTLREYISKILPNYMVPSYFIQLSHLPIGSTGKLDTKLLPKPTKKIYAKNKDFTPINETEKVLLHIWKDILKLNAIDTHENFFEIGGDSIKAINMILKIYREFKVEIGFESIFHNSTIATLAKYLQSIPNKECAHIQHARKKDSYLMSSAQKRIYMLSKIENESISYNIPAALLVHGTLDILKIEQAYQTIIERHEILRTSFNIVNDHPMQIIHKNVRFHVEYVNEPSIDHAIAKFIRPFDLSIPPLLRITFATLPDGNSLMLFDMHHIISDGTSLGLLATEFVQLYKKSELPPLTLQYKDFSEWQNNLLQNGTLKKQETYWLKVFTGEIPLLNLPLDYPRPPVQSFEGSTIKFKLDLPDLLQLKNICAHQKCTLYTLLLAAYNILLFRYTNQEDIVVGSPISGRHHEGLENMIGVFVNTVPIRNFPTGTKRFSSFLKEVDKNVIEALENQDYQFEKLVEKLDAHKDLSRNPLFDTMLVLQNVVIDYINIDNVKLSRLDIDSHVSKFDLLLNAFEKNDGLFFEMEFSTKLFLPNTIQRLCNCFITILKAIPLNLNSSLSNINIIDEAQRDCIINSFNNTYAHYPKDKTISMLFDEQVFNSPNNTCVVFNNSRITYKELSNKIDKFAFELKSHNIQPNDKVAILITRSIEFIVTIFGVLKAGGTLLPIDIEYPIERIKHIIKDASPKLILLEDSSTNKFKISIKSLGLEYMNYQKYQNSQCIQNIQIISDIQGTLYTQDIQSNSLHNDNQNSMCDETSLCENNPNNILYIIYTSGSTGIPKGVMITNTNIVNLIYHQYNKTNINFKDNVLQFANSCFDVCYQEIFSTLLCGGELHIIDDSIKKDIYSLFDYISMNHIDTIFLPSAYLKFIASSKEYISLIPTVLTHIITAGEQLIISDLFIDYLNTHDLYLHNHYGPSETHVVTTYTMHNSHPPIVQIPPIGKPISNTHIYILNDTYNIQPIGVWGELYITGDSVGLGYLNDSSLTKEKFIKGHNLCASGKLYKTQDIARWLPDGNIEFGGRTDNQVKIRGYRIELGEIETCLLKNQYVKDTIVIATQNLAQLNSLCAYVVCSDKLHSSTLVQYLSLELPEYMIPEKFVFLDKIPLTTNGKVDKNALPSPTIDTSLNKNIVMPRNAEEYMISKIWKDVLDVQFVGIDDGFFELGGNSLTVMHAVSSMYKCGINITPQHIYKYKTIRHLFEHVLNNNDWRNVDIDEYKNLSPNMSKLMETLPKNNSPIHPNAILLTGSTGFLGIHILSQLIDNTKAKIYCLSRGPDLNYSINRLTKLLNFYFNGKYTNLINDRIIVINGNISDSYLGLNNDMYYYLGQEINLIIHCAAIVKHFGKYSDFEKVNVEGTKPFIEFAAKFNTKLDYISTIAVSGNKLYQKRKDLIFTENDLYIGQNVSEIPYVKSKFEAEKMIFEGINSHKLNATIYRVGNITGRNTDGMFQVNPEENAFYNVLKSVLRVGLLPEELLDKHIDITPVDLCSNSIFKLSTNNMSNNNVFHIYNYKTIQISDLTHMLNSLGLNIEIMKGYSTDKYIEFLTENKPLEKSSLEFILTYIQPLSDNYPVQIMYNKTKQYLNELGFEWNKIDKNYIEKMLRSFKII